MQTSDQINEIATALAAAQSEIEHASKDRENAAFKQGSKASKYATLASVDDACRPALTKHGIAVVSAPAFDSATKVATVETRLIHKTGQWISATCSTPVSAATAQGIGSAITYLRRYTLAALAGVAPADDDDDGNAATGRNDRDERPQRSEPARQPEPARQTPPAQSDEAAAALATLVARGWTRDAVKASGVGLRRLVADTAGDGFGAKLWNRIGKRIVEAQAAGVLDGLIDTYGKPATWGDGDPDVAMKRLDAIKADTAKAAKPSGGAA